MNMNILDEIIAQKYREVDEKKALFPVKLLEKSLYYDGQTVSLSKYITRQDKSGIIAEIKRKSPSRGVINAHVNVERTSIGYMQAGASALSVLTDERYFGGSNDDLRVARKYNFCPILRKDFIVDEYQIVEAKSIGADAILLIAAALEPKKLKELAAFAHSLGLEILLEVHNKNELDSALNDKVHLVGVNNRDLQTFEVDVDTSKKLATQIPDAFVKVSESGLHEPEVIAGLKKYGYQGFLIGERFMISGRPEKSCARFINILSQLETKTYA